MMKINLSIPVILHPSEPIPTVDYFLSNLDQNLPVLLKQIYSFPATTHRSGSDMSHVLRTSLQKALVHFYPFVGRLSIADDGKLFVRFSGDVGVPFVEATADCELEQLGDMSFPHSKNQLQLIYCPSPAQSILQLPLLTVQLTKFKCGGFSIGLVINHSIADGVSIGEFRRAWAEIARGCPLSLPPFLDRSILCASQVPDTKFHHPEYAELAPYVSGPSESLSLYLLRRFVFDYAKLSHLKQLATAAGRDRPSTFASLVGFTWSARTKALNIPSVQPTKLLFTVDVRKKLKPPLPRGFFGNGFVFGCCLCPAGLLTNRPLNHAVEMVQDATRGVTNGFVRSTIDCYELTRARPSLAGTFIITSWTLFGVEAMDFSWGPATQFGPAEMFACELAIFRPHGEDDTGISITLSLPAAAMRAFEELMDF